MKSKSKALKKWAKKHGYKVKKLKLKKAKPSDLRGFLQASPDGKVYKTPENFKDVYNLIADRQVEAMLAKQGIITPQADAFFKEHAVLHSVIGLNEAIKNREPKTESDLNRDYFHLHQELMKESWVDKPTNSDNVAENMRITALYGMGEDWPLDITEMARD